MKETAHNHEHSHSHEHGHEDDHHHHAGGMHVHPIVKNMRIALLLNVSFTIIEFVGGIMTNSMAILSDAIHDLGDSIAIVCSLVLEKKSTGGRTQLFTYGKRRLSVLAAFFTSLILIAGSVVILTQAIPRFFHPESVNTGGVLWLAVIGVIFNGLAFFRLFKGKSKSVNQRAVMMHLMEDALGWIVVMVGGFIMYFTSWMWIDPLLSIGVAVFILYNALRNIMQTLKILLQVKPDNFNDMEIKAALLKIPGITNIHDLHAWTMDGEYNVLTTHLVLNSDANMEDLRKVRNEAYHVLSHLEIHHPTLQFEFEGESCALTHC